MAESYFVGFRKETREKHALLLGVSPNVESAWNIRFNGYEHNIYVRTFKLLNWSASILKDYLLSCEEHGTKFVCLEEGFCFDGSIPAKDRKRSRHYTVMQCRLPKTGNSLLEVFKHCEPEDVARKEENEQFYWYDGWEKIINDYFKTSPTDPNRHLYTIEQLAHLHGKSVSYIRRLIEKSMEKLEVDLREIKKAKLLRKTRSEFKRQQEFVELRDKRKREHAIMREREWLQRKEDDLKHWMALINERLQLIEDEVTRNIKEMKSAPSFIKFRGVRKGSMMADPASKVFIERRYAQKASEKIAKIKDEVEKYNDILNYITRRLSKLPNYELPSHKTITPAE